MADLNLEKIADYALAYSDFIAKLAGFYQTQIAEGSTGARFITTPLPSSAVIEEHDKADIQANTPFTFHQIQEEEKVINFSPLKGLGLRPTTLNSKYGEESWYQELGQRVAGLFVEDLEKKAIDAHNVKINAVPAEDQITLTGTTDEKADQIDAFLVDAQLSNTDTTTEKTAFVAPDVASLLVRSSRFSRFSAGGEADSLRKMILSEDSASGLTIRVLQGLAKGGVIVTDNTAFATATKPAPKSAIATTEEVIAYRADARFTFNLTMQHDIYTKSDLLLVSGYTVADWVDESRLKVAKFV